MSFSGRERNCCFLNIGERRFADVSAISGLDFTDDARAVSRSDWDRDGDVDLWIANRSGPQLRYLRNDTPSQNHFLAIRLVGQSCNRDAIGARVELTLEQVEDATRIQTLRAGDGYLSQSSKWLHFGLGRATRIKRLVVHWPGGPSESFPVVGIDAQYRLVQGSGICEAYTKPPPSKTLDPSQLEAPPRSDQVQVLLSSPIPLPRLDYESTDGRTIQVPFSLDRPLLLNLWASWCQPCLVELAELAKHEAEFAERVDVLALSVDRLGDDRSSKTQATELLHDLSFPHAVGWATEDLVEKIHLAHRTIFESHVQLPIPSSILINRQGELAAVYEGPLTAARLLNDVEKLASDAEARRSVSLPLVGRWAEPRLRARLLPMVWELIKQGRLDDGLDYIDRHQDHLDYDIEFAKLLALTGYELLERGDVKEGAEQYRKAIRINPTTTVAHLNLAAALARLNRFQQVEAQYREALVYQPNDARIHDRLAWLLATAPDADVRNGDEAVFWAEKAARATRFRHGLVLETLAAAYAQAGRFDDAITTATKVLQLARQANDQALVERTQERLELFERNDPYHEQPSPTTK